LDQWRSVSGGADRPLLYKRRANSLARKKPFEINRKKLIAASAGSGACCRLAHRQQNPAELLCSAKN
jgi:hypothetical protein